MYDSSFSELLEDDRDALETSLEQIADEYHAFLEGRENEYSVEFFPDFKEVNASWRYEEITRVIRSTVLFDRKDAMYLEISAHKNVPDGVKVFDTGLAVVDRNNISSNIGFAYETVRQFTEEDLGYDQSL